MSARYSLDFNQHLEIDSAALIAAFPAEWKDAQSRDLSEEDFAVECFRECDFETLAGLASAEDSNFDWMAQGRSAAGEPKA